VSDPDFSEGIAAGPKSEERIIGSSRFVPARELPAGQPPKHAPWVLGLMPRLRTLMGVL
jgi:hypothetical protein